LATLLMMATPKPTFRFIKFSKNIFVVQEGVQPPDTCASDIIPRTT
jgi:hypothetical protein